jgi:hypothetical protein
MEIADFMGLIKILRQNTLPRELDLVEQEIAALCAAWAQNVDFKLHNCEETLKVDSTVSQWIESAQNAALSSHQYILEDGPELSKVLGPHAQE